MFGVNDQTADFMMDSPESGGALHDVGTGGWFTVFFKKPAGVLVLRCDLTQGLMIREKEGWRHIEFCGLAILSARGVCEIRIGSSKYFLHFVYPKDDNEKRAQIARRDALIFKGDSLAARRAVSFYPAQQHERCLRFGNVIADVSIGHGGFGHVFKGYDMDTGEPRAVKMMTPTSLCWKTEMAHEIAMNREIRGTEHCITSIDDGCDHADPTTCELTAKDCMWIAMELGVGDFGCDIWTSLSRLTKFGLIKSALKGLAAAHELGVIHGDVSPGNIMVMDPEARLASIMDWGRAEFAETRRGAGWGPAYLLAPEISHWVPCTNKVDIWSFAAASALFLGVPRSTNMAANQRPGAVDCLELQQSLAGLGAVKPGWGPLYALLGSMLSVEADRRPSAAEALASPAWDRLQVAEENAARERRTELWDWEEPLHFDLPEEHILPEDSAEEASEHSSSGLNHVVMGGEVFVVSTGDSRTSTDDENNEDDSDEVAIEEDDPDENQDDEGEMMEPPSQVFDRESQAPNAGTKRTCDGSLQGSHLKKRFLAE